MKKDKGFSFIMTIIVILVVSIIVASCIAIAMSNFNMKKTKSKAVSTYYSAEEGLDLIKAKVEERCIDCMRDSYTIVLKSSSSIPSSKIDDEFAAVYYEALKQEFNSTISLFNDFQSYLSTSSGLECISVDDLVYDDVNKLVLIKGIDVKFTNSVDNYESEIKADLELSSPDVFQGYSSNHNIADIYSDYVLFGDKGIQFTGSGGTKTTILGSMYAGNNFVEEAGITKDIGGIVFGGAGANSEFDITCKNIITRSDIIVRPTTSVSIKGTENYSSDLYMNNLVTEKFGANKAHNVKADLDFDSNVYVKNSTLLNVPSSDVKISGSYFGYSKTYDTVDEEKVKSLDNSSFCINAKGVNVDLTGLKTLWIAGSSYLDIPQVGEEAHDILLGESLTGKHSQSIYLVPSKCIIDNETGEHLSNPIDAALLHSTYIDEFGVEQPKVSIDLSNNVKRGGIDFWCNNPEHTEDMHYCKGNNSYTEVHVKYTKGQSLDNNKRIYLYLDIKGDKLGEFGSLYNRVYSDYMVDRAKAFELGDILIGENSYLATVGGILTYDGNKVNITRALMDSDADFLLAREELISEKYLSLCHTLEENKTIPLNSTTCFENVVNTFEIVGKPTSTSIVSCLKSNDIVDFQEIKDDETGTTLYFIVADGDVSIQDDFKGVIIATGNVEIVGDVTMTGTIFSGGVIDTSKASGCELRALDNVIEPLAYLLIRYRNKDDIRIYFDELKGDGTVKNTMELSSYIKYRNWVIK